MGSGGLTLGGNGYLALSGPNTYSGVTTISGGTLNSQNGSGGAWTSLGSGSIVNNGTLLLSLVGANYGNDGVFNQVISGSGTTVIQETGGSVYWVDLGPSAQLSAAGDVVVNTGLQINQGPQTIGALNGSGYIFDSGSSVTLTVGSNGHSGTYSGGAYGPINLVKTGSGIQVLTSGNNLSGSTTVSGGTVYANPGNNPSNYAPFSYTSGIMVNSGATLEASANGLFGSDGTQAQPITVNAGGTAIADTGAQVTVGLLTLNGGTLAGDYNGSPSGSWRFGRAAVKQLAVTDNSTVTATGISMYNGATINVSSGKTLQFNGTIVDTTNGPSSLITAGPGTIVLNAANTYTGATTVNTGTLALGASNAISNASTITVNSSGTLDVSAATGYTVPSGKTITVNGATVGSLVVAQGAILTGSGSLLANAGGQTASINGQIIPGTDGSGTLAVGNIANPMGLHLGSTSAYQWGLSTTASGLINVQGTVTDDVGATIQLDNLGGNPTGHSYTLLTWTGPAPAHIPSIYIASPTGTVHWTGGGSPPPNWDTGNNWDLYAFSGGSINIVGSSFVLSGVIGANSSPYATSNVVIAPSGGGAVTGPASPATVNSLSLGNGTDHTSLAIQAGGPLTVTTTATLNNNTTLSGPGTLSAAVLNVTAGTATLSGGITVAAPIATLSNNTTLIGSGVVSTTSLSVPSGGTAYVNGITVQASSASTSIISGNLALQANGLKIDTNNHTVTLGQSLGHDPSVGTDGGLTKLGLGTLQLNATQAYNGPTVVANGTLMLGSYVGPLNFIGVKFSNNSTQYNVTGTAGAPGGVMPGWNNVNSQYANIIQSASLVSGSASLNYSNSTSSSAVVIYSYTGAFSQYGFNNGNAFAGNNSSPDAKLMDYYSAQWNGTLGATLTNIPYPNYSIYAYLGAKYPTDYQYGHSAQTVVSGPGATYYATANVTNDAVNFVGYQAITNTDSSSYPMGNYVVFSGLSGGSQTVTCTTGGYDQEFAAIEVVPLLPTLPSTTALQMGSGVFDLNGGSQQVASVSDYAGGGGSIINNNTAALAVLTISPTGTTTTYSGSILSVTGGSSGDISLVLNGDGTQVLSGANTYAGGTTIDLGVLQVGNTSALGAGAVAVNGGTLDLGGYGVTVPSFSGAAGTVTTSATGLATLTVNQAGTTSFNGTISAGSGKLALAMTGGGTLYLSGANTYSGGTNIKAGVLQFTQTIAMSPSGTVAVSGGAVLAVNAGGPGEFDNGTSGMGSIGGLVAGTGGQGAPVTWAAGAILVIDPSNAPGGLTYPGIIADSVNGSLGLAKLGGNTLTLTASNTYSGGTTISGGTLQLGTGAAGQDGSLANTGGVTDNAALVFDLAGSQTAAMGISGSGSLTMAGSGTLVLSGTNIYTGGTTVEGGTLIAANNEAIEDGSNLYVGNNLSAFGDVVPTAVVPSATMTALPEPGTLGLLSIGAIVVLAAARRRSRHGAL